MASNQWKQVELAVARALGGIRSWQTDHDVLVVQDPGSVPESVLDEALGPTLLALSKGGLIKVASVEVKNQKALTVPMLERLLEKNAEKMARDGLTGLNVLVYKRKAGRGYPTPYLLLVPLEVD